MSLFGNVIEVSKLEEELIKQMYELMNEFYVNVDREVFINDLYEKDYILLLKDVEKKLRGFTTIMIREVDVVEKVVIIYSGDTIIHKDFWGTFELPRVWFRAIFNLTNGYDCRVFWILLTKGYKTYKFLPAFMKTYYPNYKESTPKFEKDIIDTFCTQKFGDLFDKESGILLMNGKKDSLKEGVADIEEKHLKNQCIKFFCERNPGYIYGNELVSISELSRENLRKMSKKFIEDL